jgi:hypothetical protein
MEQTVRIDLTEWMATSLEGKAASVKAAESGRLRKSPAVITSHQSATKRRWMKMAGGEDPAGGAFKRPLEALEVNSLLSRHCFGVTCRAL